MNRPISLPLILVLALVLAVAAPLAAGQAPGTYPVNTILDSASQPKYLVIFYGVLDYSTLEEAPPDILVFAGTSGNMNSQVLADLKARGTTTIAYLHDSNDNPVGLGSSYKNMVVNGGSSASDWVQYIEGLIDNYAGKVDGVFLDEADPAYFTSDLSESNPLIQDFNNGLAEIVSYAHSKGLLVVVNGVRAYAGYGDYYLWEGWCSTWTGSVDNPSYSYVSNFFDSNSGDDNPYSWVNDYAKYQYLADNNLLGKTLAVSFGDPLDYERQKVCSYSAWIAGFHAWGYADANFYATSTGPAPVYGYSMGPAITPPLLDPVTSKMSRKFYGGIVEVQVGSVWSITQEALAFDTPSTTPTSYTATAGDGDQGYDITGVGVEYDGFYYSFWITLDSSLPNGVLRIYVDNDSNADTGYDISSNVQGIDFFIEARPPSGVDIYKYIGDGTTWSWSLTGHGYMAVRNTTYVVTGFTGISQDARLWIVSIDSNWTDRDVEPDDNQGYSLAGTGGLYAIPLYILHAYLQSSSPDGVAVVARSQSSDSITLYAPTGYYSLLTYYSEKAPQSMTQTVGSVTSPLYHASSLQELESYSGAAYYYEYTNGLYKVTVKAGPHQSPVTLNVDYGGQALGVGIHVSSGEVIGLDGRSCRLAPYLALLGIALSGYYFARRSGTI